MPFGNSSAHVVQAGIGIHRDAWTSLNRIGPSTAWVSMSRGHLRTG
jgi:hypothetical protein